MRGFIKGSTNTILNTDLNTGEGEKNIWGKGVDDIESPLAWAIRKLCGKRTLILSPNDKKDLEFVLKSLYHENATVEQVEEFKNNVPYHPIGTNWKIKKPRLPRIMQVLEFWYEVREMDITEANLQQNYSEAELDALAAKYA